MIRALVYSRAIADTIPARRSQVLSFLAAPKPFHHAHFEYNTALRPWGGANFYTGQSYSLGNAARHPLETVLQGGDTYNSGHREGGVGYAGAFPSSHVVSTKRSFSTLLGVSSNTKGFGCTLKPEV